MKRAFWAPVLVSMGTVALGACGQNEAFPVSGPVSGVGECRQYTSCAACTPIVGCGWCYLNDGSGRCAVDPNECAGSTEFTWTWDPSGCYVPADAGVAALDAGPAD